MDDQPALQERMEGSAVAVFRRREENRIELERERKSLEAAEYAALNEAEREHQSEMAKLRSDMESQRGEMLSCARATRLEEHEAALKLPRARTRRRLMRN